MVCGAGERGAVLAYAECGLKKAERINLFPTKFRYVDKIAGRRGRRPLQGLAGYAAPILSHCRERIYPFRAPTRETS